MATSVPYFKTKSFKTLKNLLFGIGAAVVIVGAWAKILHLSFANVMLTAGLLTEALIFTISGIVPPEPDYYWEKYYPGVDTYDPDAASAPSAMATGNKKSISAEMDKMLEAAKVDQ